MKCQEIQIGDFVLRKGPDGWRVLQSYDPFAHTVKSYIDCWGKSGYLPYYFKTVEDAELAIAKAQLLQQEAI